ncbi:hypothetical protein PYCC9005_002082 [Savitreella phatthalungensis]
MSQPGANDGFNTSVSSDAGELDKSVLSQRVALAADHDANRLQRLDTRLSRIPVVDGAIFIEFDEDDPENPYNWSWRKKVAITLLTSFMTFFISAINGAYASAQNSIEQDLHVSSELTVLGLSFFLAGFALAPLILAPISEVYGRWPMYILSAIMIWLWLLPQALARNITTILTAKFFQGCFGSTGSTMVGGTLADMWRTHERGPWMAAFTGSAFIGTFIGPVIFGVTVERLGFRWGFWIQFIIAGVYAGVLLLTLQESRGSVILSRRAARMRRETGDPRYQTVFDVERGSLAVLIKVSLTRPLFLLFTEPIVAAFSTWISLAWAVLYMLLESSGYVFSTVYGFDDAQVGYTFAGACVASVIALLVNPIQDALYTRATARNNGKPVPEARLYHAMPGSLIFTAGLFIYGWTARPDLHWIGPVIGSASCIYGIFAIYLATFNYLADAYTLYASSAIAGQSFARNMLATAFPLFTKQMYIRLGVSWASSLAGFCGLALSAVPFVLFFYGDRIRRRSKLASA